MSDWQVGDLALCISEMSTSDGSASPVQPGAVHTVSAVSENDYCFRSGLHFPVVLELHGFDVWFDAADFRKIRPHAPDAEDAETIRLLNGVPVGEPA